MLAKNSINENSIDQLNTELSKYNKVFIITQQSIIDICKVKELVKHDNLFYYISAENERCKSSNELHQLLDFLIINECNKDSILVGIGGDSY